MKSGYCTRLSTTALAVLDICPYEDKSWIITRINVPKAFRGQGHGTELLKKCLADADETGTVLWLEIQSSDGLGRDELMAWYARHGFQGNDPMRRKPQAKGAESYE